MPQQRSAGHTHGDSLNLTDTVDFPAGNLTSGSFLTLISGRVGGKLCLWKQAAWLFGVQG